MKKLCCVIHSPPYYRQHGESALDFILAASNITEKLSVIFLQQGIWQLSPKQKPEALHLKRYTAGFAALPHYDIADIYVEIAALQQWKFRADALLLPAQPLSTSEICFFLQQQDCVVYY